MKSVEIERNVFILGSGRSGTSMVAGMFRNSCYMGENLISRPIPLSPKGQWESRDIITLNHEILKAQVPADYIPTDVDHPNNAWLFEIPVQIDIVPDPQFTNRINRFIQHVPYAFKDPRFNYTLPAWRPQLEDCVYVCVFREPEKTIESLLSAAKEYSNVLLSRERAARIWVDMYRHILEKHMKYGSWLFLHYNQVIDGTGIDKLEEFTGAVLDRSFPEKTISVSKATETAQPECHVIYERLCELSNYQEIYKRLE